MSDVSTPLPLCPHPDHWRETPQGRLPSYKSTPWHNGPCPLPKPRYRFVDGEWRLVSDAPR